MRQILKVASIISMALWLNACGAEASQAQQPTSPAIEVGVSPVKTVVQELTTVLPGRSKAYLEAEVRPQVSGIILKQNFTEGGYVKQGQSLYQIDPATYQASVQNAQAELANTQAKLAAATATYKRYQALLGSNFISQADFDTAEATYKQAQAAVQMAKAALNTANINLNYTAVKAPIAGHVGKSSVTPGALVTANQATALATIQQLDPIKVDIVQSSAQMLQLKANLQSGKLQRNDSPKVKLILEDGREYAHEGVLKFAEVSVDKTTGSVTMRAEFPNPDGLLLPGMYVRAIVNMGTDPKAILVPQKAITRNNQGQAVAMVVNDQSQVEARIVTTAQSIDNQWRITHGLKEGDQLIVQGLQKIRPGAPVSAKVISTSIQQ
ncbi:efflux RND transporter periplasmic adaptor subunit [Shewanella sp. YIC-542]|uniref:efflux RND transporter periplasmic adaptor subunit n=1 Tax=Shewanella mytili TaxID=3377111 RepID=UPI00398EDC1F